MHFKPHAKKYDLSGRPFGGILTIFILVFPVSVAGMVGAAEVNGAKGIVLRGWFLNLVMQQVTVMNRLLVYLAVPSIEALSSY